MLRYCARLREAQIVCCMPPLLILTWFHLHWPNPSQNSTGIHQNPLRISYAELLSGVLKEKKRSQCFSFFTMSFSQSIAVKLHFSLQQHYIVTTVTVITAYLYLLYTYNYSCLYKVKNALHFNISVCAYLSKCKYLKVQVQFMSSKCLTLWKNCKANTCAVVQGTGSHTLSPSSLQTSLEILF